MRPSSQILTGISGSYTVEIAATMAGLSSLVRARSGTTAGTSAAPADSFRRSHQHQPSSSPGEAARGGSSSFGRRLLARSNAALSVCHARLAHFTRTGNSRTPANTDSLPRSSTSTSGGVVTMRWNRSNNVQASADRTALEAIGHHRRRGLRDRAARADEADVGDHVTVDRHEELEAIAAERIVPFRLVRRAVGHAEVPRTPVVIEDDFLIEVAEFCHSCQLPASRCRLPATLFE